MIVSIDEVLNPLPILSVVFNPNTIPHEGLSPIKGFERFERVYPATMNGFLLLILSLIQPVIPFKIFAMAFVTPEIRPKIVVLPPISRINKGIMLWMLSLEISVKRETSPIKKTGRETPKINLPLLTELLFGWLLEAILNHTLKRFRISNFSTINIMCFLVITNA